MVLGHGERMQLQLDLPGQLPDTGTYVLSDRPAGVGVLFVLHAEGWYLYDTGSKYTGYATITHVDSLSIAGRFGFVASAGYRGAPSFYSVRSGAFNVPISHDLATGPARELSATPLRGR